MKFKRIILITLLLAIFTISAVSAADENATDEVISIENNNAATLKMQQIMMKYLN